MRNLIILRGNSGSGKTTAAHMLRDAMLKEYGKGSTMLIQQDVIRHTILDGNGAHADQSLDLIIMLCRNGMECGQHVILEGILERKKYDAMLSGIIEGWQGGVLAYYYDIPLDITLSRHQTRPQRDQFTMEDLRSWYIPQDQLGIPGERIFDEHISLPDAIARILKDCGEGRHDA